jgi:hypothetical protein
MTTDEMRSEIERLTGEIEKGNVILSAIRSIHKPFGIYDECVCEDKTTAAHTQVNDVGLTCALMYRVCEECCTSGDGFANYQTEECCDTHSHGKGDPICETARALRAMYPEFTWVEP